jgi:hypothetical protein
MALLWIFSSYFIGTEPYGNCTVLDQRIKPKHFTLSTKCRNLYRLYPVTRIAKQNLYKSLYLNIDTGAAF